VFVGLKSGLWVMSCYFGMYSVCVCVFVCAINVH
jgi:hypothetical protein